MPSATQNYSLEKAAHGVLWGLGMACKDLKMGYQDTMTRNAHRSLGQQLLSWPSH